MDDADRYWPNSRACRTYQGGVCFRYDWGGQGGGLFGEKTDYMTTKMYTVVYNQGESI